jgi:hypothetical protein
MHPGLICATTDWITTKGRSITKPLSYPAAAAGKPPNRGALNGNACFASRAEPALHVCHSAGTDRLAIGIGRDACGSKEVQKQQPPKGGSSLIERAGRNIVEAILRRELALQNERPRRQTIGYSSRQKLVTPP